MREIQVDASAWRTAIDFYVGMIEALDAPGWHGRNMNALVESVIYGDINAVEPPFRLVVRGLAGASENAVAELKFAFKVLGNEGATIEIADETAMLELLAYPEDV